MIFPNLEMHFIWKHDKARAETYQNIEHSLTIADTEKLDQNYSDMQRDNQELRGIVDNLSRQLQNLERRIESS